MIPFAFLEDVRAAFTEAHGEEEVREAVPYAFNAEFSRVLSRKMEHYTTDNPASDTISRVRGGVRPFAPVLLRIHR